MALLMENKFTVVDCVKMIGGIGNNWLYDIGCLLVMDMP